MVHSEVYLNKYVVSIAQFSTPFCLDYMARFTPSGAPVQKNVGPTHTVVIIDILSRTRAAMHTTIAAMTVYDASAPNKIVPFIP